MCSVQAAGVAAAQPRTPTPSIRNLVLPTAQPQPVQASRHWEEYRTLGCPNHHYLPEQNCPSLSAAALCCCCCTSCLRVAGGHAPQLLVNNNDVAVSDVLQEVAHSALASSLAQSLIRLPGAVGHKDGVVACSRITVEEKNNIASSLCERPCRALRRTPRRCRRRIPCSHLQT